MNKDIRVEVHPFLFYENELQPFCEYTMEDVQNANVFLLTELALLIPGFLQPQGWKFKESWERGDIKTKGFLHPLGIRPCMFLKPEEAAIALIKTRVLQEGYQRLAVYYDRKTSRSYFQWDHDGGRNCITTEAFTYCVNNKIKCFHGDTGLYWSSYDSFTMEGSVWVKGYGLCSDIVPATEENGATDQQLHLIEKLTRGV